MKAMVFSAFALCVGFTGESAEAVERYTSMAATADGIGKRYHGREIARVMGYEGASWLERPEREQEERTDLLIKELHLTYGLVIADIGAGSGYLTRRLSRHAGPKGAVFGVDVHPQMVELLEALRKSYPNLQPVLAKEDDVQLPPGRVDVAIMVDVYHELAYPYEVIESVLRVLKPGGRLVLVEYRANDLRVPIKQLHTMTEAQVKLEMADHDLTWTRTSTALPWQLVIEFQKSAGESPTQ